MKTYLKYIFCILIAMGLSLIGAEFIPQKINLLISVVLGFVAINVARYWDSI